MKKVKSELLRSMRFLLCMLAVFFGHSLMATHNRAGEITYKKVGVMTYEVQIVTYTNAFSPVDRCMLDVSWGDNVVTQAIRTNGLPVLQCSGSYAGEVIRNGIRKNVYTSRHTYASVGTYRISVFDPNRNAEVKNIENSVNTPFYIESFLVLDPLLGENSSSQILAPPLNQGVVGVPFKHTLAAYDVDGDSLHYEMVNCRGARGREILSTYTSGRGGLSLETISINQDGTMIWDKPTEPGIYNVAIKVVEYRKVKSDFVAVGSVVRDMQIEIMKRENTPPVVKVPQEKCVEAGKKIRFDVEFSDPDGDRLAIASYGGVYLLNNKADFTETKDTTSPVKLTFSWQTSPENLRNYPYRVTFEAMDLLHKDNTDQVDESHLHGLANSEVVRIKLIPSAPVISDAHRLGWRERVRISWEKHPSDLVLGYEIYRTLGNADYKKDDCNQDFFASEFSKVGTLNSRDITAFLDDNQGQPFQKEKAYLYVVVANFPNGQLSYPSEVKSVVLKSMGAFLKKVSVQKTSISAGSLEVLWQRNEDFADGVDAKKLGYILFHKSKGGEYSQLVLKKSLLDTSFVHTPVNTYEHANTYRVDLVEVNHPQKPFAYGTYAASYFTKIQPDFEQLTLSFSENVPWNTDSMYVYREKGKTLDFEKIATTTSTSYIDKKELQNGLEYCYKLRVFGSYPNGISLVNESQIACAKPVDNTVECLPEVRAKYECDQNIYTIEWADASLKCQDIISYEVHIGSGANTPDFERLDILDKSTLEYRIKPNLVNRCFRVIAVDDKGNKSLHKETICAKPCPSVYFPNIFTPNGDGIHDAFVPIGIAGLVSVAIEIYDHLGRFVFESDAVDFRWTGIDKNGKESPTGVYFYFCKTIREVDDRRIEESHEGFVHIMR